MSEWEPSLKSSEIAKLDEKWKWGFSFTEVLSWAVRSHIGWREERNVSYKGVENEFEDLERKLFNDKPKKDNIY